MYCEKKPTKQNPTKYDAGQQLEKSFWGFSTGMLSWKYQDIL